MAPSSLTTVASLPFRVGSALRGRRVFHPQGLLCTGRWTIDRTDALAPSATPLAEGAAYDCLVRASRGAGLPEPLPDIPGFAVRLLDAHGEGRHQDVLANASADLPLVHHVFLPARSWCSQSYGIAVAAPLGRWRRIGTLALGETTTAAEDPEFDPWHCGGGLKPVGALQRWRHEAYRQSRKGRGAD